MIAAQVVLCVPCIFVFMRYIDSEPVLGWSAWVVGVAAYFALYAVMIWKTQTDYRS